MQSLAARPRKSLLAPTLFALFGGALLIALGTWQVQRLHWKEGLIAARDAAVHAPPIALPRTLAEAESEEFRHVRVEGRFLAAPEFHVHALSQAGDDGYHAVNAFALAVGGIVLVDRGFVPVGGAAAAPPKDAGSVTGLLRLAQGKPSWFTPDNRPGTNEWFYVDPAAMAAAGALSGVLPFYVDADAGPDPRAYPVGGQTPLDLPNNHLQYAITWYALAAALAIYYVLVVRRARRGGM
ncbi:MAG TPA: SURF1 family cytochrome oxidase biogenesis protein [Stellaceae bacterium]|nr:SURF1 family cytochrome oxidase biogenesis protein [Stellaceae bacterium]